MSDVYRFKSLKKSAAKVQKQEYNSTSGQDVVNYFLYVGIDYKGQLQMACVAKGFGGSADVSVDPFVLVGLNTAIGVGGSIKVAKQRTIIVSRGPEEVEIGGRVIFIPQPILVNSLIGRYWEGKAQLSIDVGVGFKALVGVGATKEGTGSYAEAKSSVTDEFGQKRSLLSGFEAVGVGASATAGFKAGMGYTYDYFYGEDLYPLSYASKGTARKKIAVILKEGSTKTMLKLDACEFINANVIYFGNKKMNLHGKFLWHTTTKGYEGIIGCLEQPADKAPKKVKETAYLHLKKLRSFSKKGDGTCFLRLSSHKPEGKAGLYAKGTLTAQACVASAGANAEAFAGVIGSYKKAYARYQSRVFTAPYIVRTSRRQEDVKVKTILTTYDSEIIYSTFHLGLDLSLDANFNVLGYSKSLAKNTGLGKGLEKVNKKVQYRPNRLNQIRYKTAIATWVKPEPVAGLKSGKITKKKVNILPDTGVAYGQSFVVGNLKKLFDKYYAPSHGWNEEAVNDSYVKIIAKALRVKKVEDVLKFFKNKDVREHITENLPLDMGVLLEATYRIKGLSELDINMSKDKGTGNYLVQLSSDFGKKLFKKETSKILESIRLRYRKRDLANRDSTLFGLGFKAPIKEIQVGFNIRLERVERAGADCIVDVATVFIEKGLESIASRQASQVPAYEKAVPPAALFCQ